MREDAHFCSGACRARASRERRAASVIQSSEGKGSGQGAAGRRTEAYIDALDGTRESTPGTNFSSGSEYERETIRDSDEQGGASREKRGGRSDTGLGWVALMIFLPEEMFRLLAEAIRRMSSRAGEEK